MALKSSLLWFRRNCRNTSSRFFTSWGPRTMRADFCRETSADSVPGAPRFTGHTSSGTYDPVRPHKAHSCAPCSLPTDFRLLSAGQGAQGLGPGSCSDLGTQHQTQSKTQSGQSRPTFLTGRLRRGSSSSVRRVSSLHPMECLLPLCHL